MYAYVGNNPVNFVDPTGHTAQATNEGSCSECGTAPGVTVVDSITSGCFRFDKMSDGSVRATQLGGNCDSSQRSDQDTSVNPNYVAVVRGETPKYFETDDEGVFLLIQVTAFNRLSGGVILADGEWYWTASPLTEDAKTSVSVLLGQIVSEDRDLRKFLSGDGQTATVSGPYGFTVGAANSGTQHAILVGFNSRSYDASYSVGWSGRIGRD